MFWAKTLMSFLKWPQKFEKNLPLVLTVTRQRQNVNKRRFCIYPSNSFTVPLKYISFWFSDNLIQLNESMEKNIIFLYSFLGLCLLLDKWFLNKKVGKEPQWRP